MSALDPRKQQDRLNEIRAWRDRMVVSSELALLDRNKEFEDGRISVYRHTLDDYNFMLGMIEQLRVRAECPTENACYELCDRREMGLPPKPIRRTGDCTCGHTRGSHKYRARECKAIGCDCRLYKGSVER